MKTLTKTTTLIFIYTIILFFNSCKSEEIKFIRHSIDNIKNSQIIKNTSKEIPVNSGIRINLKRHKLIKISTPYTGNSGIFLYMNFKSNIKNIPITFELYKIEKKNKKKKRLHYVRTNNFDSQIIEKFIGKKNEIIYMKFSGNGKIFISKPILYKIIEKKKRDNIIIIGIDTFRMDMLSKKINKLSITPNLDRFKLDSVTFNNCIAQSSWTLPSFTSFLTSLYEFNHNVGIKNTLDPKTNNLIQNFANKYITLAFHGGIVMSKRWGHSRGFDFYKEFKFAGPLYPYGGRSLFEKGFDTLTKSEFPNMLLFLHTYQIHDPYTPPKEYLSKINKNPFQDKGDIVNSGSPAKTYMKVKENIRHSLLELYQAEILAFDTFFGKFIHKLKKENLYNSSTIILMSDHGEEFFEHKGWGHSHSLYQELIRVPLIIKFPNKDYSNIKINKNISVIDILPTILEYKKINFNSKKFDGESVLDIIKNDNNVKDKPIVSSMTSSRYIEPISQKFTIIKDNYKIIYNYKITENQKKFFEKFGLPPEVNKIELYNLKTDPEEKRDISKNNRHIVKGFLPLIKRIMQKIKKYHTNNKNFKKKLDPEVEKQLKTIGYI